jgi:hypothetical protein
MDCLTPVRHRFASKKKQKSKKSKKSKRKRDTGGFAYIYILPITCFNYKYIKYTAPNLSLKKTNAFLLFCFKKPVPPAAGV